MYNLDFILDFVGLTVFAVGFVCLVTAAFMNPGNTQHKRIRVFGVLFVGTSLAAFGIGSVIDILMTHKHVSDIFLDLLSFYLSFSIIRQGLAEQRANSPQDKTNEKP